MNGFLLAIVVVSTFMATTFLNNMFFDETYRGIYGTEAIQAIKECEQNLPRNQYCVAVITAKPEGE